MSIPITDGSIQDSSISIPDTVNENTIFTLYQKYYRIEPEGRIRRYQYFVRCLVPGILLFLAILSIVPMLGTLMLLMMGISGFLAMMYIGIATSVIVNILYIAIFYKIGIALITKRCHDFGSDGKISITIFKTQVGLSLVMTVVYICLLMQINIPGTQILGTFSNIVGICTTIMGLILVFRPGTKGDNQYGKDPANRKVSFLG